MISTKIHPFDSRTLKIKLRRGELTIKSVDGHTKTLKDLSSNAEYTHVISTGEDSQNGQPPTFDLIEVSE